MSSLPLSVGKQRLLGFTHKQSLETPPERALSSYRSLNADGVGAVMPCMSSAPRQQWGGGRREALEGLWWHGCCYKNTLQTGGK